MNIFIIYNFALIYILIGFCASFVGTKRDKRVYKETYKILTYDRYNTSISVIKWFLFWWILGPFAIWVDLVYDSISDDKQ